MYKLCIINQNTTFICFYKTNCVLVRISRDIPIPIPFVFPFNILQNPSVDALPKFPENGINSVIYFHLLFASKNLQVNETKGKVVFSNFLITAYKKTLSMTITMIEIVKYWIQLNTSFLWRNLFPCFTQSPVILTRCEIPHPLSFILQNYVNTECYSQIFSIFCL